MKQLRIAVVGIALPLIAVPDLLGRIFLIGTLVVLFLIIDKAPADI